MESAWDRPFPTQLARLAILILLLNVFDAFCTLRHVAFGASELNPIMAELLGAGNLRFVAVKHLLVSLAVVIFLLRSERALARVALWGGTGLFALIGVYHVALWVWTA